MLSLKLNDNDIFATRGTLHIVPSKDNTGEEIRYADAEVEVSSDGADYKTVAATRNGEYFSFSGLTPGRTNLVRVKIGKMHSAPAEVAAEQDLQIPNGNLDADVTYDGSASHWENVVFQGWGTNNAMTTSQGANYGYVRISGTKQVDGTDAHSGKAARISTQGWGSGNTAPSIFGHTVKYLDAGLLHLGATRTTRPSGYGDRTGYLGTDDLDCGIAFASRPSAVTFWHKYEKKNDADYGVAKAFVYDAAGNVLASGEARLSSGSYTQTTINLNYAAGAAKAAKLYVCFLSTHDSSFLVDNESYITYPPKLNLDRGEYSGSRLYIDEVELTY